MKQLLVFLSNISSQVNESSGNFIRSDLIRVSCVVVSCFHHTCETRLMGATPLAASSGSEIMATLRCAFRLDLAFRSKI